MQNKLDFVKRNIADWTRKMDAQMSARAAALAAANAELDAKIVLAKAQLATHRNTFLQEDPYFLRKLWFLTKTREKFRSTKMEYDYAQAVVEKLENAKELIANLQRDDLLRQKEFAEQNNKINPLWDALNAKVKRNEDWDAADKENYKKIEKAQEYMNTLCENIESHTKRIAQYHRMAIEYDSANSAKFPGHWLEFATIIIEQQDIFGFCGEIYGQESVMSRTLQSGLEGYSISYGAILRPGQIVRYNLPGTQILLEQDHTGRVYDKTPIMASEQHKMLAAIKTAELLLLDLSLHPEKKIHLQGSQDYLPQIYLIVAALKVQAKQAGIVLKSNDIVVKAPGWRNWRGSLIESRAQIKQKEGLISGILNHYHAQDELKEKLQDMRGKRAMKDAFSHSPRKH